MNAANRPHLNLESLDDRIVPATFDLRAAGAEAFLASGAIAHRIDGTWNTANGPESHGLGALRTYVSIDANGVERGYNTNARPVQFNESSNTAETRALPLDRVPIVTVNGVQYREFVLDVDQVDANGVRQLSVDEVRIFQSDRGNLKNYNTTNQTLGLGASLENAIWNLDAGSNNMLRVRAMSAQGARAGEMALLVPNSLFNTTDQFVYIYSAMGGTYAANGGAEEWGVRREPAPAAGQSISGQLYVDSNESGTYEAGIDTALSGSFTLLVTYDNGTESVDTEYQTNGDGSFTLSNLAVGTYHILVIDQNPYSSITGLLGTGNGVNDGDVGSNVITGLELSLGENATGYGFLMGQEGT